MDPPWIHTIGGFSRWPASRQCRRTPFGRRHSGTSEVYRIHDGELSVTLAPSLGHQIISSRLYLHLAKWLEGHPGGLLLYAPLDVILSDRPDETSIASPTFSTSRQTECLGPASAGSKAGRPWPSRSCRPRHDRSTA